MHESELTELIERAEHLLWVIARCDVESVSAPRASLLRRIEELERRAFDFGVTDLYQKVLQRGASMTRIVL
jgi:hypothetical protein